MTSCLCSARLAAALLLCGAVVSCRGERARHEVDRCGLLPGDEVASAAADRPGAPARVLARKFDGGCEYDLGGGRRVVLTVTPAGARRSTAGRRTPQPPRPAAGIREVHAIEGVKNGLHVEVGVYAAGPAADELAKELLGRVLARL